MEFEKETFQNQYLMHGQISSLTDYPLKNHIRRSSGICAMKTLEKLFSCQNFHESRTVGVEWKRRKKMEAFNLLGVLYNSEMLESIICFTSNWHC